MAKVRRVKGEAFDRLQVALKELDGKVAKAGWFESAKYESGQPVAYIASIHEFGYPEGGIPPRPFMRPTISRQRQVWLNLMKSGAKAILAGKATLHQVMEAIGLKAAGDVAKTITQITSPPLKSATIAARRRRLSDKKTTGSLTKPLVDTGLLLASVTSAVEDSP